MAAEDGLITRAIIRPLVILALALLLVAAAPLPVRVVADIPLPGRTTLTNQRVATVEVGREAGNTQYDAVSRHIFANSQVSDELVQAGRRTGRAGL